MPEYLSCCWFSFCGMHFLIKEKEKQILDFIQVENVSRLLSPHNFTYAHFMNFLNLTLGIVRTNLNKNTIESLRQHIH